jgi:hypothetical protein
MAATGRKLMFRAAEFACVDRPLLVMAAIRQDSAKMTCSTFDASGAKLRMHRFIHFTLCLLLSGCLVLPESYYLPVSEAGDLERPVCGAYGPSNSILIESDDVWVRMWLQRERYKKSKDFDVDLPSSYTLGEKYLVLGINIVGAPDSVAVVPDQEISVRVYPAVSKKYAFNSFYRTENVAEYSESGAFLFSKQVYTKFRIGDQLVFSPREGHFDTVYWGDIWLDVDDSESVHVERIEIQINARKFAIENVDFVKKSGVYYYPVYPQPC